MSMPDTYIEEAGLMERMREALSEYEIVAGVLLVLQMYRYMLHHLVIIILLNFTPVALLFLFPLYYILPRWPTQLVTSWHWLAAYSPIAPVGCKTLKTYSRSAKPRWQLFLTFKMR
jgi:hypothetical protein